MWDVGVEEGDDTVVGEVFTEDVEGSGFEKGGGETSFLSAGAAEVVVGEDGRGVAGEAGGTKRFLLRLVSRTGELRLQVSDGFCFG